MSNPPRKAPTSPMIRSPIRPNPLPGMMTPANHPASRPMTSHAIIPPGFNAAANTSVASDILSPFFFQKPQLIPSPFGSRQTSAWGNAVSRASPALAQWRWCYFLHERESEMDAGEPYAPVARRRTERNVVTLQVSDDWLHVLLDGGGGNGTASS